MAATLKTLVSFISDSFGGGPTGAKPEGDLIADSDGDLFGTTENGGANGGGAGQGTVFEIKKTAAGYASTPTTLVSFGGVAFDGYFPLGGLTADANGDLFGTTSVGGWDGDGTVFEIVKTGSGYASTPITLATVGGQARLLADANGDLFYEEGDVLEIAKTAGGYASTPTTLVSFDGNDGLYPSGNLIADANGDLFGTGGSANGFGMVFEIKKTEGGYANTPTILVSFDETDGQQPNGSLTADANGDLFGTANGQAGPNFPITDETAFEIKKTAAGYASTPTTLVTFHFASPSFDGNDPLGGLIADANGDLFGTTLLGGAYDHGTVFEIKNTAAGYASVPLALVSFDGADGANPTTGLIADANGDLFGTTPAGGPGYPGGADNGGTVFEIVGSGFVTAGSAAAPPSDGIVFQNTGGQASIWGMDGTHVIAGGTVSPNPGPAWKAIGTGDFNDDGLPDLLWQNANSGQASIWDMDGTNLVGGGAVTPNPGPSWHAVGSGDFNHDGFADILWQNTNTGQASIWEMIGNSVIGGGAVTPNPGPTWKAIGTGDFNGDSHSDILWQNTSSGQVSIWEMSGDTLSGGGPVTPNPGPAWKAIGTGDFNDDGFSDILFQNRSTGQVSVWEMDGTSLMGGGPVSANPGPSWHAIGTGDFNGDGFSDILLQNTSGQAAIWDMNGNTIIGGGAVSANAGPSWRAVGLT